MKTLDDVKSTLIEKGGDDGKELFEVVSNAILNAKNDRKRHVSDLETQNERLSGAVKDLGYDGTGELSAFVSETKKALKAGHEASEQLTGDAKRLQELEKRLGDVEGKYTKSESERLSLIEKSKKAKVKDAVLSMIKDKIFSAELRASHIADNGMAILTDDGKVVWKDGSEELDLEKGIGTYLEQNKEDLKNTSQPGPGSKPGDPGSTGKTMKVAEFDQLSTPEQHKVVHDGVKVID